MKEFTLRELCEMCNVSRRAVQGYTKRSLIEHSGKTNRGYLLFDESAAAKTKQIKSLQNYGFSLDEIEKYYSSDTKDQNEMLKQKRVLLEQNSSKMISYIEEIKKMINEMEKMV